MLGRIWLTKTIEMKQIHDTNISPNVGQNLAQEAVIHPPAASPNTVASKRQISGKSLGQSSAPFAPMVVVLAAMVGAMLASRPPK